jgi:pimeloyl-ACP methyl ester carboxylesterase
VYYTAAMAKTFRPYRPEQDLLLPPSLRDWLPEDHLAYFVSDLVDQLDLSAITAVYEADEPGYPPYHPVMLAREYAHDEQALKELMVPTLIAHGDRDEINPAHLALELYGLGPSPLKQD